MTLLILLFAWAWTADAFCVNKKNGAPCPFAPLQKNYQHRRTTTKTFLSDNNDNNSNGKTTKKGDPLRAATGIRPSLHPLTINVISTALVKRATQKDSKLRVGEAGVEAMEVALAASKIVTDALQKRQEQSQEDGMQLTPDEGQTVAGRVVGVVMRLPELEQLLLQKCQAAPWIAKYGEWSSFGVLPNEDDDDDSSSAAVDAQIKKDPLFSMNRAECLLALFMATVEQPELQAKGASVPDGGRIDFLDADRQEVLLG